MIETQAPVYIGVDGGASKTQIVALDAQGQWLGQALGPAATLNGRAGSAWQIIEATLRDIQPLQTWPRSALHLVVGIAGTEITQAYQDFRATAPDWASLAVVSDAHIACAGAHALQDGAIIAIGTGVVGFRLEKGMTHQVAGWGFPHDDRGSGAWLGLEAVSHTLAAADGRAVRDGLAEAVLADFHQDARNLAVWACQASAADFAVYARLVVKQAEQGVDRAVQLLDQAARYIDDIAHALLGSRRDLTLALTGGLAPVMASRLAPRFVSCLTSPRLNAAEGAARMAFEAALNH